MTPLTAFSRACLDAERWARIVQDTEPDSHRLADRHAAFRRALAELDDARKELGR